MLDRADAILKIAIAIAALCLGCGVGFYYAIFLPQQAAAAEKHAADLEREKAQAAKQENEAKAAAHSKYDQCLSAAQGDYSARWDSSCVRQNQADIQARQNCYAQGFASEYCASFNIRPAKDCALPSSVAASYDQGLKEAKQLCVEELRSGT